jgi:acyl-CoA reductase-like NAD-dependent aldehyde dehydrogenase
MNLGEQTGVAQHIDLSKTYRRDEDRDEAGPHDRMIQLAAQVHRAGEILRRSKDLCANVMSLELKGESIADLEAEIERCSWACELLAHLSSGFRPRSAGGAHSTSPQLDRASVFS